MVPTDGNSKDDLSRHLARLPREPAPEIAVESLFERLERVQRRSRAKAVVGLFALLGIGLWALSASGLGPVPRTDAPVYLDVRIVDAAEDGTVDGVGAPSAEGLVAEGLAAPDGEEGP